jgi:hypothetical protein
MLEEYLSEKQRKKKRRRRMFWIVAAAVLVFLVLLLAVWIVTESPIFRIDRFAVTGNRVVASGDITTLLRAAAARHRTFWSSFLGVDNMLVWPNALATSDLPSVPQVASVALEKNYWSHTLTAVVTERQPLAIWCGMPPNDASGNPSGNESCFWFDDTGTLFARAFDTEGNEILAVHDRSGDPLALGGTILPDIFIGNMLSILNVLKESGLIIKDIALNDMALQEIDVSTYNGPTIYFSLRFNADEDLPVLRDFMQQPNFDALQYVDFRTENRAYYQ